MLNAILTLWSAVLAWIVTSVGELIPIFANITEAGAFESLTLIGEVTFISLGIGIVFLALRFVENKLHFKR